MAWYIQSAGGIKATTRNTLASKIIIQIQRRDEEFARQKKYKEFIATKPALQRMLEEFV